MVHYTSKTEAYLIHSIKRGMGRGMRLGLLSALAAILIPISGPDARVWAIEAKPDAKPDASSDQLKQLCQQLKKDSASFKWKVEPCEGIAWQVGGASVQGRPLVFAEFGNPENPNTTLVFSMVHGDEITPLYLALQLVHWMKANPEALKDAHVVIAPLVNPDGFIRSPRTRMNDRGVDVNRNFPTKDWPVRALAAWKKRFRSDPRRFPGPQPASEPETIFQQEMIRKFKPQKILSVHAPLNFMDYDGPSPLSLARFPGEYVRECVKLRTRLKAISSGFFPGSLGNFAGQEQGIPTLTLELPSADYRKADEFWEKFKPGIRTMIEYKIPEPKAASPSHAPTQS